MSTTCKRFCSRKNKTLVISCIVAPIALVFFCGLCTGLYFLSSYYILPFIQIAFNIEECQGRRCVFENIMVVELCILAILLMIGFIIMVVTAIRVFYKTCSKEWEAAKLEDQDSLILNGEV